MGVDLEPDEVAYRCNLVTVDDAGTMVDFAAGHVTSEQSHLIVAALDARSAAVATACASTPASSTATCAWCRRPRRRRVRAAPRPHRSTAVLPTGPAAAKLVALMDASKPIVA